MRNQLIAVGVVTGTAQLAAFVKVWVTARLFGVLASALQAGHDFVPALVGAATRLTSVVLIPGNA